ncbi:hypothetical protein WJX75_000155 [Coccomyxa subellipsoidea]|uniref:Peptidase M23 n=1 Tax=Coccomyxa subellipsoidea TaxID=248742 RepID=A0ABR2YX38_9CHLO
MNKKWWTVRPIVLLAFIFLTLGFLVQVVAQDQRLQSEQKQHILVVKRLKAQQSDMLKRVSQLEQSI